MILENNMQEKNTRALSKFIADGPCERNIAFRKRNPVLFTSDYLNNPDSWVECGVVVKVVGDELHLDVVNTNRLFPNRPFMVLNGAQRRTRLFGSSARPMHVVKLTEEGFVANASFENQDPYNTDAYVNVQVGDIVMVSPYWLSVEETRGSQ